LKILEKSGIIYKSSSLGLDIEVSISDFFMKCRSRSRSRSFNVHKKLLKACLHLNYTLWSAM